MWGWFKCVPADCMVPSALTNLSTLLWLPGVGGLATAFGLPFAGRILVLLLVLGATALVVVPMQRAHSRSRGVPSVSRSEAGACRDAWAASQPVWRLILVAILPFPIALSLFVRQFNANCPLWGLRVDARLRR